VNGFKTREDITEWAKAVASLLGDDNHLSEMSSLETMGLQDNLLQ